MFYENRYEYLNQESRLPLLKVLKKYKISKKDMEEIESILWWTYDKFDMAETVANFYEKKYGCGQPKDFKEWMMYYNETHQQPVDYTKLNQKSVYDFEGENEDD